MRIFKQEYIGLDITIVKSTNSTLNGLQGTIIDETKNTFKILTSNGLKIIMKNTSTFKINGQEIKGSKILKKSYDRIKLKTKN